MTRFLTNKTLAIACCFVLADAASAATLGQTDDFNSGANAGWGASSQAVSVQANGGPLGAGDGYLAYSSLGSGQGNSRMVIPNEAPGNQWAGDYGAAGITGISLDVLNPGATTLDLRLAIADGTTWYASNDPVQIAAGSDWTSVLLQIAEDQMTRVGAGSSDFATVLANVGRVRLLSSVDLPPVSFGGTGGAQGDRIAASIGIDNVTAVGVPEPAALLLASIGLMVAPRRRR